MSDSSASEWGGNSESDADYVPTHIVKKHSAVDPEGKTQTHAESDARAKPLSPILIRTKRQTHHQDTPLPRSFANLNPANADQDSYLHQYHTESSGDESTMDSFLSGDDSDLSDIDEALIQEVEAQGTSTVLEIHRPNVESSSRKRASESNSDGRLDSNGDEAVEDSEALEPKPRSPKRARLSIKGSAKQDVTPPKRAGGRGTEPIADVNCYHDYIRDNHIKVTSRNNWANPGTPAWDIMKVLGSDGCLAPDNLLKRPTPDFSYIVKHGQRGRLVDNPNYDFASLAKENDKKKFTGHPKYAIHVKNNTITRENHYYYSYMPKGRTVPLAGIIDIPEPDMPEAKELEESFSTFVKMMHGADTDVEQEENFHARPSIEFLVPDHIKAILVDDWENVTKNQQLVPLPAPHPVKSILDDYLEHEAPKREAGSHQADLLLEVVAGLGEYFEKCLGRILLYRFERQQYLEVRQGWAAKEGELSELTASTTYGAEHFCRLLVTLPELLAQTNMDQQSCNRLCLELQKLTHWLGKNAHNYFRNEYETPGPSYIDKARNG